MESSSTPLSDALRRIREHVSENDRLAKITFSAIHDHADGTPAYDLDGEWIWRKDRRKVRVDFDKARRGFDVFFLEGEKEVDCGNFLLSGDTAVELRVGDRILAFLLCQRI